MDTDTWGDTLSWDVYRQRCLYLVQFWFNAYVVFFANRMHSAKTDLHILLQFLPTRPDFPIIPIRPLSNPTAPPL